MATQEASNDPDHSTLFQQLDSYPWDEDSDFRAGLGAILGSVQNPEQVEHLTLRAKCYYYARKAGTPVDFDGYKQWVEAHRDGAITNGGLPTALPVMSTELEGEGGGGGMAEAPKPASFAEICDLIAEGKPIPGIKDIPDTILEGQSSESQVERRKKPWEKSSTAAENPSWMS